MASTQRRCDSKDAAAEPGWHAAFLRGVARLLGISPAAALAGTTCCGADGIHGVVPKACGQGMWLTAPSQGLHVSCWQAGVGSAAGCLMLCAGAPRRALL
jgi:hypothetical protein